MFIVLSTEWTRTFDAFESSLLQFAEAFNTRFMLIFADNFDLVFANHGHANEAFLVELKSYDGWFLDNL